MNAKLTGIIFSIILLITATAALAQAPAPAPAPNPCKVVGILQGGLLEKGGKSVPFKLRTKGCEDVTEINADEITFTDVEFENNLLSARAVASDDADNTVSLSIKDGNGVVNAPKSVHITVLGQDAAYVNKIAKKAKSAADDATDKVKKLSTKLDATAATVATRPTKDEVIALVAAAYEKRVSGLEKAVAAQQEQLDTHDRSIGTQAGVLVDVVEGQRKLASTPVKTTFFGGAKPLSPEVAAIMIRVQTAKTNNQ